MKITSLAGDATGAPAPLSVLLQARRCSSSHGSFGSRQGAASLRHQVGGLDAALLPVAGRVSLRVFGPTKKMSKHRSLSKTVFKQSKMHRKNEKQFCRDRNQVEEMKNKFPQNGQKRNRIEQMKISFFKNDSGSNKRRTVF